MAIDIIAGPILGFRGSKNGEWQTSALVVVKDSGTNPKINFNTPAAQITVTENPKLLRKINGHSILRLEWRVTQTPKEQTIDYTIDGAKNSFRYFVPELNKPLRIAYGSCFGFSSPGAMKKIKVKNQMWIRLKDEHQRKPYHLMLMGGDQVYADMMFETVQPLQEWFDKSISGRVKATFTKDMEKQVERFYFDLYCQRWGKGEPGEVLCQIPSLMMWDDHDIFDGWGSYPAEQQKCAVFQGIYRYARDYFRLFQLQAESDLDLPSGSLGTAAKPPEFTYGYRIGDLAILALDMRSDRSQDQVMTLAAWDRAQTWMYQELAEKINPADGSTIPACKHLLIMSSIPVVYINANMIETIFGIIPGQQELEDDFKDQWLSRTHHEERIRLIHRLLKFSMDTKCRVTIVSGDVHVGALGYIKSTRDLITVAQTNVINQLISSGMVHPPPPGIVIFMMDKVLGDKVEEIDRDITAQMLKFPGSARRFIGARNWLSLTFDDEARIWAEWFAEGEENSYTKVVHPAE